MANIPLVAFVKPVLEPELEIESRFVLDEEKFMFDIGYVPPAARPENFAYYTSLLDELAGDVPAFLADPSPAFLDCETYPRRAAGG